MKLIESKLKEKRKEWKEKGYELFHYDVEQLADVTKENPSWIHFGAGNIFRAFPAACLQQLLNQGKYNKGVIVCEGFDYEIIEKAYTPYENLSLLIVLCSDGTIKKQVIGSVVESLTADREKKEDQKRLIKIFQNPSLQMVSFTITEKGYCLTAPDGTLSNVVKQDFEERKLQPEHIMGKIAALLYERYKSGAAPIAMVSMDNCSHNGDKLRQGVTAYVDKWAEQGLVEEEFQNYIKDSSKVSFPWSMIDKITPRPDEKVQKLLQEDEFLDAKLIITSKHTYTSSFVNAEETQYLVMEDNFPNGRPPLEESGILFTDRETVDKVEKMKVCTCLNPLHTALAIYGCLLSYNSIWEEMEDPQLKGLITKMGYEEGMPVVVNPKIIKPEDFIKQVLEKRLPNPFMPDTPQRIATDTSQKIPIRFGETLKAYQKQGKEVTDLTYIPLVIAGYLRYLMGVDDKGERFELSPDPLLKELMSYLSNISINMTDLSKIKEAVKPILERTDLFQVDLYEIGLADKITNMFLELIAGKGAVRATLKKYVK